MTCKICVRGTDPSDLEHLVFLSRLIDRRTWNERGTATNEPAASGNQTIMIIDRIRVVRTDLFTGSHCLYFLYLLRLLRFRTIQSERPYYRVLYFAKSYHSMDT